MSRKSPPYHPPVPPPSYYRLNYAVASINLVALTKKSPGQIL